MDFQKKGCPYLGCASQATQNRSPVYELCWRLILGLLLPILGFDVHKFFVGDSLKDAKGERGGPPIMTGGLRAPGTPCGLPTQRGN